ncbi:MAG TPA: hypothetical protein VEB66_08370 [Opitutaceae bacterium]|nr:hypothetical protein [Opitutaceae bacterium]
MTVFGLGLAARGGGAAGWITGLKVAAVAVVAHAVLAMWRAMCPDVTRSLLALAAAGALLVMPHAGMQVSVIAVGGALGWALFRRPADAPPSAALPRSGLGWLMLFVGLLALLPLAARTGGDWLASADRFYRAGALVFGGGMSCSPCSSASSSRPAA